MPYATRQGVIDFPKRKCVAKRSKPVAENDLKKTPESKPVIATSASSSARKAFHSCADIICRENEIQKLTDFLLTHLSDQTSGSMYISGLPGTGKTATVNHVIEKNELSKKYQVVKINCTAFNSSSAVFKRICELLKLRKSARTEKETIAAVEKYLLRKHKIILLILDEIDQLENKTHSVLYKIFEWPSWENAKFVLIGIANAMDLTDRILPRLCARVELKPVLLHFAPYTKSEITEILKSRLTEAGVDRIFAPGSIELIAAKVAGTSGDIRRALDLAKRVVEVAELRTSESPLKLDNPDLHGLISLKRKLHHTFPPKTPSKMEALLEDALDTAEPRLSGASPQKLLKNKNSERVCLGEITPQKCNLPGSSPGRWTSPRRKSRSESENAMGEGKDRGASWKSPVRGVKEEVVLRRSPRKLQFDVDSKDVLSVVKNVFASSKNFKGSSESIFPLHQKLLICTVLLIMKKGQKKDLNVGKLHQVYSKVCAKRGLTAVDKSGFLFLCRQVEVSGVVQIGKGAGSLARVTLQWDEAEVADSLKDLNLMSSILNDTACLC